MESNDDSLEKVIEEEETSTVTIKRSAGQTEDDNEEDSNDVETSVMDESLPELGPPSTYSTEPSNVSSDRRSGADRMRRWSASAQQHDSPRRSRLLLPEDVRPARSRSDSEIKEYGPVRKWAVDYNNRNYIRSFCHKPTGNHRKPMGRTFDWDVDFDNLCYIRSLIRVPKGLHRRMKEVPRKTVPDNDILADSTGWQFEYGHDFPQVEEDVPYTPQERVVARGAYRCYGVNRSQSDTFLNVDIEREPFDDFREDEFKYGREFLQDDMPLMILGKDRRTLRGGYRFYDVDRSKCDQYTSQNDNDGYDEESENITNIPKGRKFKRTILKKTLQYPKQLTDRQFGTALSFVPGEGSEESLEGISTTLPSLRPKKRGARNACKKTLLRDVWKRPNETRYSRPPHPREEALRRASEKAEVINNLRRASMRRDSEEEYYPDRNRRDSYRAQEERRVSRIRNCVPRGELAFQPRVSFEYEQVRPRTKSFDRTPQSRRAFKDEKIEDDVLERRISNQRRRSSFRGEDSYQKRGRMEDVELERRTPGQRRRSSLRDEDPFQKREMVAEVRDRRMSNQSRRSSLREEEPYKARMDDERVRRISNQIRKPIMRSEDSYQTHERDEKKTLFKSTPVLGRRKTDDTIRRGISPIKQHPRTSHDAHQARMYDDTVRRIPDQVRRSSRRSKDLRVYQGEESDEDEEEETFISTAVLGRRPTVDATERRRSTPKEHPRMVYHQGDESDEEEETFTSTAVFGRRKTSDGMERRRSPPLKDHPRMVYHQGDESDNEETFTSTAVFGMRQTDDAMKRRRSSQKEQPRMSYGHHQPHKEQPRISYDRHQSHKEHPRMVHHQAPDEEDEQVYTSTASWGNSHKEHPRMVHHQAPDDEDEQVYTSTASWGNPHQTRQASRKSGQGYSSMASY